MSGGVIERTPFIRRKFIDCESLQDPAYKFNKFLPQVIDLSVTILWLGAAFSTAISDDTGQKEGHKLIFAS